MLRSIRLAPPPPHEAGRYPFNIAALRGVDEVEIPGSVVFLVGENGSGKSTLMEALAVATELPTLGSRPAHQDPSLAEVGRLAATLRLSWSPKLTRGFFLRAEDVFGFLMAIRRQTESLEEEMAAAELRLEGASDYARQLGLGPYRASLGALRGRYGENPDARSHGETFLHLFRERLAPGGLYLMDEPEAALSPTSQLALVALMADAVRAGSQFVIATHSPLLLAIPDAVRLSFDQEPLGPVAWEALDSVRLWRDVMANPERLLRMVWEADP